MMIIFDATFVAQLNCSTVPSTNLLLFSIFIFCEDLQCVSTRAEEGDIANASATIDAFGHGRRF